MAAKKTAAKKTKTSRSKKKKVSRARASSRAKSKGSKPLSLSQALKAYAESDISDDVAKIVRLADDDCVAHVRHWFSTGSLELDRRLTPEALRESGRVGGLPAGRVVEIYGPAHIGKSTLLDQIIMTAQRSGGAGVLLETDSGRDASYTGRIGVDMEALQYIQFAEDRGSIENATDKAIETIRWWKSNAPDVPVVVGFDALGVTPTEEELEKSVAKGSTGSAAKVMRRACRKIAGVIAGSNVVFVILNHEYQMIRFGGGVTANKTYGGDGLALLAALRLKLHRVKGGWLKSAGESGEVLGHQVGFEITKFKLGPAFRRGTFAILSGTGVDNPWTLWEGLKSVGVLVVSGSWGAINLNGDVHKFQGWLAFRQRCLEDPEFFAALVQVYRERVV